MVGLGDLPGGFFRGWALAVNADGTVIVGQSYSDSGREAFRWTDATGMVGLGDLPGGDFESGAWAVSVDGSIVAGSGSTALGGEAFIWDAVNGMRNLNEVLVSEYGMDLGGCFLTGVDGVSADGRRLAGTAINPQQHGEAYRLTLPKATRGCGFGVGTPALAFSWCVCLVWLSALKRQHRHHQSH